jgi:uncharacterized membrane protein (GlpM family)
MVSDSLLMHFVLAFAVGSLWVTFVTIIADRRGIAAGGILGGLPSTSAISFLFIGLNQSSSAAAQATTVFPLVISFTSAFLLFYAVFARKGFGFGLTISLLIWLLISIIIIVSGLKDFLFSLGSGVLVSAAVYYFFVKRLSLENLTGKKKHYTSMEILGRGVGAGSLVFFAVLLSQIGGPILGGIASAFPAVFTSTLIILHRSEGTEFSRAMAKPLVMSCILTVIPFSVAVRYLYPIIGIWLGTVSAYAIIAPLAVLSYRRVQPKRKQREPSIC